MSWDKGGFDVGSGPHRDWFGLAKFTSGCGWVQCVSSVPVPCVGNMVRDPLTGGRCRAGTGNCVQVKTGRSHPNNERRLQRHNIGVGHQRMARGAVDPHPVRVGQYTSSGLVAW